MAWWSAPSYVVDRLLVERALAVVYVVAFVEAAAQGRALFGARGILPARPFVRRAGFRRAPSLFQLHFSDPALLAVGWTGAAIAASLAGGLPEAGPAWAPLVAWLVLWVLYLSVVNVGQVWYGFGWESLLLEAGFLAAFLGPTGSAPPVLVLWLLRWLLFRLEFGAGLIKIRGDRCWRDLTCLAYHHETQPMPGPFSWWFHHLPRWAHKAEVVANHVTQLVVPWLLFAPEPVSGGAAAVVVVTQAWLVASGNFAWLNVLTIVLAFPVLDPAWLAHVLPAAPARLAPVPAPLGWAALAVTAGTAVLSWWPVRNMASRHQLMNAPFNPLHLVNTYGAFGSVTRRRYEVVLEGTLDADPGPGSDWREYRFKGKPGDPARRPPQIAPYHLRLDWLMWFAAISPGYAASWFRPLVAKLLEGDPRVRRLLGPDPFGGEPPRYVRARLYRYAFTSRAVRRADGRWWDRELVGEYLAPTRLGP